MRDFAFNPDWVDWAAYSNAVYQPSPRLLEIPDYESFWKRMGGKGDGFNGETERQRALALELRRNSNGPVVGTIDKSQAKEQ